MNMIIEINIPNNYELFVQVNQNSIHTSLTLVSTECCYLSDDFVAKIKELVNNGIVTQQANQTCILKSEEIHTFNQYQIPSSVNFTISIAEESKSNAKSSDQDNNQIKICGEIQLNLNINNDESFFSQSIIIPGQEKTIFVLPQKLINNIENICSISPNNSFLYLQSYHPKWLN